MAIQRVRAASLVIHQRAQACHVSQLGGRPDARVRRGRPNRIYKRDGRGGVRRARLKMQVRKGFMTPLYPTRQQPSVSGIAGDYEGAASLHVVLNAP